MKYNDRFKDAPWASMTTDIIIGGAGGTGSWVSLLLARAGHRLTIYDFDKYDYTNIAGQFMKVSDVDKYKAEALKENIHLFCGKEAEVEAINEAYTEDSLVAPIMVSCFDSMKARKIFFNNWNSQLDKEIFIDTRQNAENRDVFFVTPDKANEYLESLVDDSEIGYETSCSYKATSHTGAGTAELVLVGLNNYLSNVLFAKEDNREYETIRYFPFKVSDDLTQSSRVIC